MRLTRLAAIAAAALAAGAAGLYVYTMPWPVAAASLPARTADLRNGETLFRIGGCASCHASDKDAAAPALGGGYRLKTAFGTFVAPNISSDATAGIGAWSEAEFVSAMTRGVGRRGEHLYPSFPYAAYQRMPLDDVRDLHAYMRTLPAVAAPAPPHELAFPFNIRAGVGLWKLLYLDGRPFEPQPGQGAAFNRGAYLVEGPGHCAECHSRRDALGGIRPEGRMAGGPNPAGAGFVPNITQHPQDGLADWTPRDFELLLKDGGTPAGGTVADEMEDVVANTSRLTDADRSAMAIYLKSLPPKPGRRPAAPR